MKESIAEKRKRRNHHKSFTRARTLNPFHGILYLFLFIAFVNNSLRRNHAALFRVNHIRK